MNKERFGELLIRKNLLSASQLEKALAEQKRGGGLLGGVLLRLGLISEDSLALVVLAHQMDVDFIHVKEVDPQPAALARLSAKFANHFKVFPWQDDGKVLSVAMANPLDTDVIDGVAMAAGCRVRAVLSPEKEVLEAIRTHYGLGADAVDRMMTGRSAQEDERPSVEAINEDGSEASISRFLNQMLLQAYHDRASDIHIEPFEDEVRIRYRIDGVLCDANAPENLRYFRDVLISRIKIMANLNIAEKRLPQDGRIRVQIEGQGMDLRVSFMPTPLGESVVIRILNSVRLYSFEELGFVGQEMAWLQQALDRPHGIIFITGPTGSGKTTTLYSCLAAVNAGDTKIITVEDPVEYQLKGIIQVQANPGIGLTFAATLRSMLRHDPDILMVGEVRNADTAQIAIQASLTGHLVFSTLHTNDAPSSVTRLLDMGVEPFLIASAVQTIIAQRLVRHLCPRCRVPAVVSDATAKAFGLSSDEKKTGIYTAHGCKVCRMSGYDGRLAIAEFLLMDDELRALITRRASVNDIRDLAARRGMKTLKANGWEKVRDGLTSSEEVLRVIQ